MQNQIATAPQTPRSWIREDGWTPDRQSAFLNAIAEGSTVEQACRLVDLSVASAYAFRNRAAGASFALGWSAARLKARDKLADVMLGRAFEGTTDTVTAPDGSVIARHRHDNRLGMAMLTRLDRMADEATGGSAGQAARLVAQEFDAYLDMLKSGDGPARAGLFVGLRATETADPDLAAVAGLARADRYLRTRAGLVGEVDVADLDWERRDGWTAEQWQRAEAAGLLSLAVPEGPVDSNGNPPHPQHLDDPDDPDGLEDEYGGAPVFRDDDMSPWMTRFPPPDGFAGKQVGAYGDEDYARALSADELAILEAIIAREVEEKRAIGAAERDAYFKLDDDPPG